jgi:hypothetical protein
MCAPLKKEKRSIAFRLAEEKKAAQGWQMVIQEVEKP